VQEPSADLAPPPPGEPPPRGGRLRGMWLDVEPLRDSPDYRRLWFGDLVGSAGQQFTVVALPYQVFTITHSSFDVGLIGAVQLVPLLAGALAAGAIADAFDRRRLLIASQAGLGLACVALALLSAGGHAPLSALFALSAVVAAFGSLESPVRNAAVPQLVGLDRLPSAAALNQVVDQTSQVAGPALAGLVLATLGVTAAYAAGAAAFALAIASVARLRPLPPAHGGARPGFGAVVDGFRFARRQPVLLATFAIDLNAMTFGMPRALFPALAASAFHVGAQGLGLMYAAPAAGALVAALSSGWVARVRRQGLSVVISVVIWGCAVAGFGLVPDGLFWAGLALLAVAGAADVISAVFRNTILQTLTPDELRGRMAAMHIAVVTSGPRLGDVEAGTVARFTSAEFSVVSGGLACVAGVLVLHLLVPGLARYRRP
jgi:MFS family permease